MGSGQSRLQDMRAGFGEMRQGPTGMGLGIPGGGIAGLAPQMGGQMGGFGQMMNQAVTPPGGQYGAPLPGTPGMFPTQSSAMGATGGMQTTQMPPGGFMGGGQMAQPAQQLGGTPGMFQTQQQAAQSLMDMQNQIPQMAPNGFMGAGQMPQQFGPQVGMGGFGGGQMAQPAMGPFAQAAQRQQGFGASLFGGQSNPMAAGLGAIGPRPGAPSMTRPRPTGGRPAGFEGYR